MNSRYPSQCATPTSAVSSCLKTEIFCGENFRELAQKCEKVNFLFCKCLFAVLFEPTDTHDNSSSRYRVGLEWSP